MWLLARTSFQHHSKKTCILHYHAYFILLILFIHGFFNSLIIWACLVWFSSSPTGLSTCPLVVLNLRWGRQWGFLMLKRVILKHVHIVKCLWSQAPHNVLEKQLCISLQKCIDKWFLLKYVKTETHIVVSVHLKAKLYNQSLLIQSWFQDAEKWHDAVW